MEAGVPIGAQPYPDPDDVQAEATVLRMLLGAQLRRLREAEGMSPERAGYEIDILPAWFETYLGLESAALSIRSLEVQFVPGRFQTEDYARAVTRRGHHSAAADEIERRVALRVKRKRGTCRTWSTSSSSPAPCIWTSDRMSSTTWRWSTS